MWQEAMLAQSLQAQVVQCRACEHFCVLQPGQWGKCGVRANRAGTLYLTVYGEPIAAHIDPIEKKPLFHFLPGARAFSIGTYGCNLRCDWCQNWQMSQVRSLESMPTGEQLAPEHIVEVCQQRGIETIAYTYNEPTIFFEYTYDIARLAHARGIKNLYVSNGFMSQAALEQIGPYLDAINVDLKGFTDALYRTYTGGRIEPVKRNIAAIARETQIWIEVTTLVIPGINDSDAELRAAAEWLVSVDSDMPWHISAFHPMYKMTDRPRTPSATLERAYEIGKTAGIRHLYVGNILDPTRESTYCPQCQTLLIRRFGLNAQTLWREPGVCHQCGARLAGVWK